MTPTTSKIHRLVYGDEVARRREDGIEVVAAPLELLREIHVVDPPGTNAIEREHEAITRAELGPDAAFRARRAPRLQRSKRPTVDRVPAANP